MRTLVTHHHGSYAALTAIALVLLTPITL